MTAGKVTRVRVSSALCVGHALCASKAPKVYILNDEGLNTSDGRLVDDDQIENAKRGAARCPERAITFVEEER